jgi:hypothetical protein
MAGVAAPMLRKQVYLAPEQNRKLKALAARRGCTEAEIIREALDQLPEPHSDEALIAELQAEGLLAPKPSFPHLPQGAEAEAERAAFEAWLDENPQDLKLVEAVLEDRRPR